MRILIVTQHYYPETVATGRIMTEVGDDLAGFGHAVTVLTGVPNHPSTFMSGQIELNPPRRVRMPNGVRVIRVPVYRSPKSAFARRSVTYGTFLLMSLLKGMTLSRFDCIIAITPLPTCLSALAISLAKRIPMILDLQDIWPEGAMIAGALSPGPLYDLFERLEYWAYDHSSFIASISNGFSRQLIDNGVPPEKIVFIPNGVDVDFVHETSPDLELARQYDLVDKFCVVFIGNHGLVQGLDCALDAAKLLAACPDIRFVFVGEGVAKPELQKRVGQEKIGNCVFIPGQPRSRVPGLLCLGKINLVTLLPTERFGKWIPSKTYESMASERPIVTNVPGETSEMVRQADCGLAVTPGSPEAVSEAVLKLYGDEPLRRRLGLNGLEWVRTNATRKRVAERFRDCVERAVAHRRRRGVF